MRDYEIMEITKNKSKKAFSQGYNRGISIGRSQQKKKDLELIHQSLMKICTENLTVEFVEECITNAIEEEEVS